jgi:arylformamidase
MAMPQGHLVALCCTDVGRSWQIEDLPFAMELWGDPAVTALIDSRGLLTGQQVEGKLLPLGINLAVIEYTLAPTARLDRIVAEVRRSVRWLTEHLGEYGADSNRLYVAGHSAGGHLTAMTMPLAEVRGGIAISGIYDLEPIRLNYLNEKLGLDLAEAERNSPVRRLPAKAGELVVAYGTEELPELCRQSTEYGRRWTERGLPGYLLPVDGADHFTILDALARPEGALTGALLAMLGR